jgi:CPA2 family monovalent cation:H+ antiporter-2
LVEPVTGLHPFIRDISITLTAAGSVVLFAKRLGLPLVLAYLFAGILCGPNLNLFSTVTDIDQIRVLSELGIIFLLFGLGLEFSFRKLKQLGFAPIFIGMGEVLLMLLIGFLVGKLIGLQSASALTIGFLLSISSTGVIIKIFQEKKLSNFYFAQTVIGILIIEDLFAILFLLGISFLTQTGGGDFSRIVSKEVSLLFGTSVTWLLCGTLFLPIIVRRVQKYLTNEVIIIGSLGLCLGACLGASYLGVSTALAAFLTGSIVSETHIHEKVDTLTRPIRDFFSAIFYVAVGMLLDTTVLEHSLTLVCIVTSVAIIGKFITVSLFSLLAGRSFEDAARSGLAMMQIGEFSIVMVTLACNEKLLSSEWQGIIITAAAFSILITALVSRSFENGAMFMTSLLPSFIKRLVELYRSEVAHREWMPAQRGRFQKRFMFMVANGLIVTAIFLVMKFVFLDSPDSEREQDLVYFFIASLLSSPFLLAMTGLGDIQKRSSATRISPLQLLSLFFTLLFYVFISLLLIPDILILLSTAAMVMVLLILFSSYLHRANIWVFKTLSTEPKQSKASGALPMGPWDEHLHAFTIDPLSPVIEQTLTELDLRNKFGVNVILHQRGSRKEVAPTGDTKLFPGDTILVLGFDNDIQKLDQFLAAQEEHDFEKELEEGFTLTSVQLETGSAWDGRALSDLDLQTSIKGVVVAVERGDERFLTPRSDFVLCADDFVWLVMDKSRLSILDMFSNALG